MFASLCDGTEHTRSSEISAEFPIFSSMHRLGAEIAPTLKGCQENTAYDIKGAADYL